VHTWFWWGHLKERDNLDNLGIDRSVIFKVDFKETGWEGRDWINVVCDEYKGWAVVRMVMHASVIYMCVWEISQLAEETVASQAGLFSMELLCL
jgi:hypothetical protein